MRHATPSDVSTGGSQAKACRIVDIPVAVFRCDEESEGTVFCIDCEFSDVDSFCKCRRNGYNIEETTCFVVGFFRKEKLFKGRWSFD